MHTHYICVYIYIYIHVYNHNSSGLRAAAAVHVEWRARDTRVEYYLSILLFIYDCYTLLVLL